MTKRYILKFSYKKKVCGKFSETVRLKEYFSLADINMMIISRKAFFPASLPRNRRSFRMCKTLKDYRINKCGLEFTFCAGVCSSCDDRKTF